MRRRRVRLGEAFKTADTFWRGSENDVTGFALPLVAVHALWYRIVGVPVRKP
jgi:hypothetical protein